MQAQPEHVHMREALILVGKGRIGSLGVIYHYRQVRGNLRRHTRPLISVGIRDSASYQHAVIDAAPPRRQFEVW